MYILFIAGTTEGLCRNLTDWNLTVTGFDAYQETFGSAYRNAGTEILHHLNLSLELQHLVIQKFYLTQC